MRGAVWAAILGGAFSLLATSALAADRHVYLDTDNDGTLNDCPNPIHNAFGTSNANDLQYCNGGTSTKKVIGTTSGHVTIIDVHVRRRDGDERHERRPDRRRRRRNQ
jgi:hypothetical protein